MSQLIQWLGWRAPATATPTRADVSADETVPENIALFARSLCRSFGTGGAYRQVVNNVDFSLDLGQVGLLMGPAGSGKSTLLAILSGLLKPEAGIVSCLGRDLWAMSAAQREVFRRENCGFVFQGANLLPALSARKQLELVLRWGMNVGAKEAAGRSAALLEELGLKDKMDLLPSALSGGEKQRVAIGRALIKGPRLLFADEPTSALDWEKNGLSVARKLRDAAKIHGAMVLVVSHDDRLIEFADRVFRMNDGRMTETPKPTTHRRSRLSDSSAPREAATA